MNKNILILGVLALGIAACNGGGGVGAASQADTVKLDIRCAADSECPSGFQCEDETEHGVTTSYCVSDEEQGTSTGECPAGYELETEHEGTYCKPHGGGADDTSGGGGSGGGDGGVDDTSTGTTPEGGACTTSADCAAGLECETQIENGVTTSTCKVHGGNG